MEHFFNLCPIGRYRKISTYIEKVSENEIRNLYPPMFSKLHKEKCVLSYVKKINVKICNYCFFIKSYNFLLRCYKMLIFGISKKY